MKHELGHRDPRNTRLYLFKIYSNYILRRSNEKWKSQLDTCEALPYGQFKIA